METAAGGFGTAQAGAVAAAGGTAPPLVRHGRLSFVACRAEAREHEVATQCGVAQRLAGLLGCAFAGTLTPQQVRAAPHEAGYLVPNDTLTSLQDAQALGIHGEEDFFGGVVPRPFVATKVITHPLPPGATQAPEGWSQAFPERVRHHVLPGWSAFGRDDARAAGRALLAGGGALRLKLASGIGGTGQWLIRDAAALDACLAGLDAQALARHGLVLEANLAQAQAYSIGLLRLGRLQAAYAGTQRNTLNRHGQEVYGGSTLTLVRGGLDALHALVAHDEGLRLAVGQVRAYHEAALEAFPGLRASRANYDVVRGLDAQGRVRSGVLEQSWRIGGASGAEVAALQALCADPRRRTARASTVEDHDPQAAVPPGADLYYRGTDGHAGTITKYALLHDDEEEPIP